MLDSLTMYHNNFINYIFITIVLQQEPEHRIGIIKYENYEQDNYSRSKYNFIYDEPDFNVPNDKPLV